MEEEDVYVTQLRDVFESCDLEAKGYLDRSELIDLCQRLQLDDQIPSILTECIGNETSNGKVGHEINSLYLCVFSAWNGGNWKVC